MRVDLELSNLLNRKEAIDVIYLLQLKYYKTFQLLQSVLFCTFSLKPAPNVYFPDPSMQP